MAVPAAATAALLAWCARPGVGVHDSGELAAAAVHLGIAHPAGSPFWLLLANAAAGSPLAGGPALRIALLSVLASAVTAAAAAAILRRAGAAPLPAAALAAAVPLLPRPFWAGIMVEVYALELALATLLVLAAWRAGERPDDPGAVALTGLTGGLLLAVHHSLAPGVLAAVAAAAAAGRPSLRRAAAGAAGLALGLSPYLELVVRAGRSAVRWADTATLPGLLRHLTSAQYRAGLGPAGGLHRLGEALAVTGAPVPAVVLPLAAAGLVVLWRRSRPAAVTLAAVAAADLGAAVWLQSMPLDSEAYLVTAAGLAGAAAAVAAGTALRAAPRLHAAAALPVLLLAATVPARSERTVAPARWTTMRRLAAAPPGAVLWLRGDSVAFPAVYHRLVEGWRPDVTILHPWGFVGAPWLPERIRARPADPAARSERDRLAAATLGRAAAAGRAVRCQDRVLLGRRLVAAGTLWAPTPPSGPLPPFATLSPLPGEGRWRHDPDPTVRGLAQMEHLPLGFTAARREGPGGARREAALAADSSPSFATVHRALGQGWLDLGLFPEAAFELGRAVRLDPADAPAWLALGVARVRTGDREGARRAWRRAARLRPGWAPPLVDLARLALQEGDRAAAIAWARRAAATGDAEARVLLRRLLGEPNPPQPPGT